MIDVVKRQILRFDQGLWIRMATRADGASGPGRDALARLASSCMVAVDAAVREAEKGEDQGGNALQIVLQACADERGGWERPLAPDARTRARDALAGLDRSTHEPLLAAAYGYARAARERGDEDVVELLQEIMQARRRGGGFTLLFLWVSVSLALSLSLSISISLSLSLSLLPAHTHALSQSFSSMRQQNRRAPSSAARTPQPRRGWKTLCCPLRAVGTPWLAVWTPWAQPLPAPTTPRPAPLCSVRSGGGWRRLCSACPAAATPSGCRPSFSRSSRRVAAEWWRSLGGSGSPRGPRANEEVIKRCDSTALRPVSMGSCGVMLDHIGGKHRRNFVQAR